MSDNPKPVIISLYPSMETPEAIEFYRWLGICVTIWAYIDRRLYQIFHHATGFQQKQSAFNNRLRLVDTAVKMFFTKD
jgi:hypothetical protein